MSNMSYCRFQNTYGDLRDCYDNWEEGDLSDDELEARNEMYELCKKIVEECEI